VLVWSRKTVLSLFLAGILVLTALPTFTASAQAPPIRELPKMPHPVIKAELVINVAFLGVPREVFDSSAFFEKVIKEYTPPPIVGLPPLVSVQYSYKYYIWHLDPSLANAYARFIIENHRVGRYPWQLPWAFLTAETERVWYVDAVKAEKWLLKNLPAGLTEEGYTIVFIDTSHTKPSVLRDHKIYYFYNASGLPEVTIDAHNFYSEAFIAFGGDRRLLFMDLSAGPKRFPRIPPESVMPIFHYVFPRDVVRFSEDLAFYVNTAIACRFTPLWLFYTPYHPSYFVRIVLFNNETEFDYARYIDTETILRGMRQLMPHARWEGELVEIPLKDRPELREILRAAYNRTWGLEHGIRPTGRYTWDPVYRYLSDNLERYAPPKLGYRVVPLFIFAGIGGQGFPFLGIMHSLAGDGHLTALSIPGPWYLGVEPLRRVWFRLTRDLKSIGIAENHTWALKPGDFCLYGRVVITKFAHVEIEISVKEGVVDFYLVDRYNYILWNRTMPFKPLIKAELGEGVHTLSFKPERGDAFYIILANTREVDSAGETKVIQSAELWPISYTAVGIHEIGHFVSLPHPFNFFDHGAITGIVGFGFYFLWDEVRTVMGYSTPSLFFDYFDFDSVHRGMTLRLLDEHYKIAKLVGGDLKRLGFGEVPPNVHRNFTLSLELRSKAVVPFTSPATPDYVTSFKHAISALEAIKMAHASIKESLFSTAYTIVDTRGEPLQGALLRVVLPNRTVITRVSDEKGRVFLENLPWGDYTYEVHWKGVKVHETSFRETGWMERVFTAKVYHMSIKPVDANGRPLTNFKIHLTWPNRTTVVFTTPFLDPQAPTGTYIFWVEWQGSDVTDKVTVNLVSDYKGVMTRVYSLRIPRALDAEGNPYPAIIQITAPNGTRASSLGSFIQDQAQGGLWTFEVNVYGIRVAWLELNLESNYERDLILNIARLSFRAIDSVGRPLKNAPIAVRLANGTEISVLLDAQGALKLGVQPFGRYDVLSITWHGVDVLPLEGFGVKHVGVTEGVIQARVYDLKLEIVDTVGRPLSRALVSVLVANGTTLSAVTDVLGSIALPMSPVGRYEIVSAKWQGIDVTPVERPFIELVKEATLRASVLVYDFELKVVDLFGLPLAGAGVTVRHPNGTLIIATTDPDGILKLSSIPTGRYTISVTYLGQTKELSEEAVNLAKAPVTMVVEVSERVLGLFVGVAVISIAAVYFSRRKKGRSWKNPPDCNLSIF